MIILPKLIYRFNKIPAKIPVDSFIEIAQLILKSVRKCKGCSIAKTLENKQNRRLSLPNCKTYIIYSDQDSVIGIRISIIDAPPLTIMFTWFFKKVLGQFNEERIVFLTNSARTVGYLYVLKK